MGHLAPLRRPLRSMFETESLISDFPILDQSVNGRRLVYLDNAATTQKPMTVLLTSRHYYESYNANIHRGTHQLARMATGAFEKARQTVARYLNAASADEVVFTAGTTAGINLVSNILALSGRIGSGDEVLVSALEHHSNIVPWQMLCQRTGAALKVIPCHDDGTLDQQAFHKILAGGRVKLLAFTSISNAFGTMPHNRSPTCRPTCGRWVRISWCFPATRSTRPPASACCGAGRTCSTNCRPGRAAAR